MLDSSVGLVVKRSQAENCRSPEIPAHPIYVAPRKISPRLWLLYQVSDCLYQSAGDLWCRGRHDMSNGIITILEDTHRTESVLSPAGTS